ncbi:MAG TPA: hypothetical protein VG318_03025 [Actinomycetota bacterium]|nr:hypothetical protein [Actinomycetota bacterium]
MSPTFADITPAAAARLLRDGPVALRGRVKQMGAATDGIPPGDATAVVAVEEVLAAPRTFPDVGGRDVTIILKGPARRGEHAVFLVRSWTYGTTIGVVETARVGGIRSTDKARSLFAEAVRHKEETLLRERISGAEVVVAGVVVETRPAGERAKTKIDTEHAPQWWEAMIDVEEVFKGDPERRLVVLFPTSTDEIWIDCPKLQKGLRAIFVLRRDQQERGGPGLWAPGLTALEPIDVQPVEDAERIRGLTRKSR